MDRFNTYINEKVAEEKGLEQNWVYTTLTVCITESILLLLYVLLGIYYSYNNTFMWYGLIYSV